MRYCTPEQARILYDLGLRDDNAPSWYNSHNGVGGDVEPKDYWISNKDQKHYGAIPALGADALALIIPYDYVANKHSPEAETTGKWWMAHDYNTVKCDECDQYEIIPVKETLGNSIAETMAALAIKLLQEGRLKIGWCNEQLKTLTK